MRRAIVTTAGIVAVLLLGIAIGLHLGETSRAALAQAGPPGLIIAAAGIQNDAFCFLYNPATKQLVSYQQRANTGLELKAIRTCDADFNPKILEYPRTDSRTAVRKMNSVAEELSGNNGRN